MSTKFEEGCYFDSARGRYIGEAVIELAESLGMTHEEERTPEHEFYCEAWEDAENWLNRFHAEDGYFWGSTENGDFGYWKIKEEESEEDEEWNIKAQMYIDSNEYENDKEIL